MIIIVIQKQVNQLLSKVDDVLKIIRKLNLNRFDIGVIVDYLHEEDYDTFSKYFDKIIGK